MGVDMVVLIKDKEKANGNYILEDFLCRWGGMRWHWFEEFSNTMEVNYTSFMNNIMDKMFNAEYSNLLREIAKDGNIDELIDTVHEIELMGDLKGLFTEFGKDIIIIPDSRLEEYKGWWIVDSNTGLIFRRSDEK